jgi:hypothetical protein
VLLPFGVVAVFVPEPNAPISSEPVCAGVIVTVFVVEVCALSAA